MPTVDFFYPPARHVLTPQERIARAPSSKNDQEPIMWARRDTGPHPTCPTCLTLMQARTRRFKCLTCGYSFVTKPVSAKGCLLPFWGSRGTRRVRKKGRRGGISIEWSPTPKELARRNHIMEGFRTRGDEEDSGERTET